MKKLYNNKILIGLAVIVNIIQLHSQPINNQIKDVVMPAPNVAALGKYGDIPVSYFTGVPNITIPIYSISEGQLLVPINLSYHAAGIRVAEMASWVGTGWSLSAGGSVSRIIQGIPDDDVNTKGYYNIGSIEFEKLRLADQREIVEGYRDSEPDLFSYSFGNYSGKFYIDFDEDSNAYFVQVPRQDTKIEKLGSGEIQGFIITIPSGDRYIFGSLPDQSIKVQERTLQPGQNSGNITTWHLIKIETHDKQYAINFSYEKEDYSYSTLAGCKFTQTTCTGVQGRGRWSTFASAGNNAYLCPETGVSSNHRTSGTVISGYRLKTISTPTVSLQFTANTLREDLDGLLSSQIYSAKRLDQIELLSGQFCKKWVFDYDYFQASSQYGFTSNGPENKRLRLKSLKETTNTCSSVQETLPPYFFTYEGPLDGGFLPNRFDKGIDHWGFFNGETANNNELVNVPPTTVGNIDFGKSKRITNPSKMKWGVLKRITYPTGGNSSFEYESNLAYDTVSYQEELFDVPLTSCGSPTTTTCCGPSVRNSLEYTFSQEDISSTREANFKLNLVRLRGVSSECQNQSEINRSVQISVEKLVNGSFIPFGNPISHNSVGLRDTIITLPLATIGIFEATNTYRFIINTRYGYGTFQIYLTKVGLENFSVGGLRVKEIRTHDGLSTENDLVKSYEYEDPRFQGRSAGKLFNMPVYGHYLRGQIMSANTPGTNAELQAIFWDDQGIIPLSDFKGYHIGYSHVRENLTGIGYVDYEYYLDEEEIKYSKDNSYYPEPPKRYTAHRGELRSKSTYGESGTQVSFETYEPYNTSYNESKKITKVSSLFDCGSSGSSSNLGAVAFIHPYTLRTNSYRIKKTLSTIDGVVSTTEYEYTHPRLLAPTAESMVNSDGKITRTTYKYPHDESSPVAVEMAVRNLVVPIETRKYVDSLQVDGSRIVYDLFSSTTGTLGSGTGTHPYPRLFYRYEMTWNNGASSTGSFEPIGEISAYDPTSGKPSSYKAANWNDAETYVWQNGLIKTRRFKDFTWEYDYYPNTRMLRRITDVDGQQSEFEYDGLMRLKKSSARGGNVSTEFTYTYALPSSVRTTTRFTGVANSELREQTAIQYFDGIGRLLQTVEAGKSPSRKDLVSGVKYDAQGRQTHVYTPYEAGTGGAFAEIPNNWPAAITAYEASPLSRPLSVTPPEWYSTTTRYESNAAGEVVNYQSGIAYPAGTLFKTATTDPNGNETHTFKDLKGRLILTRRLGATLLQGCIDASAGMTETYQVYDDKDRLTQVLPPNTTPADLGLIFQYAYDGADKMKMKKVPDADAQYFYYNTRDQMVLSQDGELRKAGRFLGTVYDDYGRPFQSGFYTGAAPATDITGQIGLSQILSSTVFGTTGIEKGKVKTSNTKTLGPDLNLDLITTFSYDTYGRVQTSSSNNHLGGAETLNFTYDFADNTTESRRVHNGPEGSRTITETYTYDHWGRAKNHGYATDGLAQTLLSSVDYTYRDEIQQKRLGQVGGAFLQTLDYSYNVQGWLTQINQPLGAGQAFALSPNVSIPNSVGGDLFYLDLSYDKKPSTLSGPDIYGAYDKNGNISQLSWQVKGRERQAYRNIYDHLDRLAASYHLDIDASGAIREIQQAGKRALYNTYGEQLAYDPRGNILGLARQGVYAQGDGLFRAPIDLLSYTYYPGTNKIKDINDAAGLVARKEGFAGYDINSGDYEYDANGNLIKDPSKNLTITYNHLNLPTVFDFGGGKTLRIVYDASGAKLRKTVSGGAEPYVQDYVGGIEYKNNVLQALYHAEGRVYKAGSSLRHEFTIKDHLGNARISFSDLNGNGQVDVPAEILQENHYYPFGMAQKGPWMNNNAGDDSKYLYNGKELNEDFGLGLYDYGARWYDGAIGRWNSLDPLVETMQSVSSYSFGFNNPIAFSDPTGMIPYRYDWEDERYEDKNGNEVSWQIVHGYIQEKNETSDDMAVLIAFPEENPKVPSNEKVGKWFEKTFGNGDGKIQGAGHAGIVLIDGESGYLRYFDFGRYNRPDVTGPKEENEGAARSSMNYPELRLNYNWNFEKTDDENVTRILTTLRQSSRLRGYGMIVGALVKGLDYDAMLVYAQEIESLGYQPFGGYLSSCAIGNATYCAKFVRGVAGAGGMSFAASVFTGLDNVKAAKRRSSSNIITIR